MYSDFLFGLDWISIGKLSSSMNCLCAEMVGKKYWKLQGLIGVYQGIPMSVVQNISAREHSTHYYTSIAFKQMGSKLYLTESLSYFFLFSTWHWWPDGRSLWFAPYFLWSFYIYISAFFLSLSSFSVTHFICSLDWITQK